MSIEAAIIRPVRGNTVLKDLTNIHRDYSCKNNQVPVPPTATSTNSDKIDNETSTNKPKISLKRKRISSLSKRKELLPSKRKSGHVSKSLSQTVKHNDNNVVRVSQNVDKEITGNPTNECYIVEYFTDILKTVFADGNDSSIFSEWDKQICDTFYNLSDDAKKMYVKMYQRKLKWNKVSKVRYLDIEKDLNLVVEELSSEGFFDTELKDLHLILETMSRRELKSLLKVLKLNRWSKSRKSKMIEIVQKHCRVQKTIFSTVKNTKKFVTEKAKKILGPCFRIEAERRRLFKRVLHSYYFFADDNRKTSENPPL